MRKNRKIKKIKTGLKLLERGDFAFETIAPETSFETLNGNFFTLDTPGARNRDDALGVATLDGVEVPVLLVTAPVFQIPKNAWAEIANRAQSLYFFDRASWMLGEKGVQFSLDAGAERIVAAWKIVDLDVFGLRFEFLGFFRATIDKNFDFFNPELPTCPVVQKFLNIMNFNHRFFSPSLGESDWVDFFEFSIDENFDLRFEARSLPPIVRFVKRIWESAYAVPNSPLRKAGDFFKLAVLAGLISESEKFEFQRVAEKGEGAQLAAELKDLATEIVLSQEKIPVVSTGRTTFFFEDVCFYRLPNAGTILLRKKHNRFPNFTFVSKQTARAGLRRLEDFQDAKLERRRFAFEGADCDF